MRDGAYPLAMRTFLCALLLASTAYAAEPAPKTDGAKGPLLARFEKTCLQNSTAEGRSQKELCACLKFNLGAKLNPEQLSLLVRFYEGDAVAKAAVQKQENSPLLDFDMEAAERCLEDSGWKATEGPRAPDADENAGEEIVAAEKAKEAAKEGAKVAPAEKAKPKAKPAVPAKPKAEKPAAPAKH